MMDGLTKTYAHITLNHWSASVPRRRAVQELNGKMSFSRKRAPLIVLTNQRVQLCHVRDCPHHIAAHQGERNARPNEPVHCAVASALARRCYWSHIRLVGTFGSERPCGTSSTHNNSKNEESR
jgi:hypothetical protein